ncbi:MAG TPA: ATP-binding cassette domain-containing protein [Dehalococcoidia bacterium]|nr:ATP-binding cassette domain-containing protein [Dehalococcoidia bacterium]
MNAGRGHDITLELHGLSKRFGDTVALDGCTFTVPRGSMLGFLGPNGAGKTTAMRSIFGLITVDAGEVHWDGHAVGQDDMRRFGYMPEQRGLYPRMEVLEQLSYFGALHGKDRGEARRVGAKWLDRLDLGDRAHSRLEDLSHGNQQRVQLLTSLLHEPELLVLDEPFTGLDPLAVQTLGELVTEQAERGTAVVFSSHHLDLVEGLCEDVVIINGGRIVLEGSVSALKANAQRRLVEIEVPGTGGRWLDGNGTYDIIDRTGDRLRLVVDREADLESLLELARSAGTVSHFSFEAPRLSELFIEAVT